jgi:hypothetical protein
MPPTVPLEREEYIEQAYFFRVLRERLAANTPTQEVLQQIDQEILATTRLPYAIQFLSAELKHTGLLSSGFTRLAHYFAPFQAFVVRGAENEKMRFPLDSALLVLEREAQYRAGQITPAGLFVYQFEALCRNRLGYQDGLPALAADPCYSLPWREFLHSLSAQLGVIDFADILYLRSELYVLEQRRQDPEYQPPLPPLFGEKEGRIARANRGKDPLYLFAALQRHLQYPEVPRPRARDDVGVRLETLQAKVRDLELRLKMLESELQGKLDLPNLGKPDLLGEGPVIDLG